MSSSSVEKLRERFRKLENDPLFVAEELKLAFAEDLVRLLEARGLKQTELAEKLGTGRGYVTRVLRTDYNLSLETMAKIALALDARISLRMLPREDSGHKPGSQAYADSAHRREREYEYVAADRGARSGRNGFIASDRPRRRRGKQQ